MAALFKVCFLFPAGWTSSLATSAYIIVLLYLSLPNCIILLFVTREIYSWQATEAGRIVFSDHFKLSRGFSCMRLPVLFYLYFLSSTCFMHSCSWFSKWKESSYMEVMVKMQQCLALLEDKHTHTRVCVSIRLFLLACKHAKWWRGLILSYLGDEAKFAAEPAERGGLGQVGPSGLFAHSLARPNSQFVPTMAKSDFERSREKIKFHNPAFGSGISFKPLLFGELKKRLLKHQWDVYLEFEF